MATSGSYDFSLTAAQIIQTAYEDLGAVEPGGVVSSVQSSMALRRLNMLVKQWQGSSDLAPGLKVHTRQRVTLFLEKGRQQYLIGPATTDARATTEYGRTTIRAAEAAGQTVLDVTALTDTTTYPGTTVTMTASDIIGIQTDDSGGDDIFWTTIASTNSTGPTVTINEALPTGRPAASGNYVWWFTSRAQRFPLCEAVVLRNRDMNDSSLGVYSEVSQYDLGVSSKYSDGTATDVLVEPLRLNTRVTLNSQPTDITDTIVLTVLYPSEDYDATSNDIAFPQEWYAALSWELAFRLSPSIGRWTEQMKENRAAALTMARSLNPEKSVLYYQPNA